jgi:ribosome-associated protein
MNNTSNDDSLHDEDDEQTTTISKTALKKECIALQDLGAALVELKDDVLALFPLDETLKSTIIEARKIHKNGAKKRHLQYIGKLMRSADYEAIQAIYQGLQDAQQSDVQNLHNIEAWRERLLNPEDEGAVGEFFDEYPSADRQLIRQLCKNAHNEKMSNKPPSSARKLFKILRETMN